MSKLQRNSLGKLLRNAAGKIIRAARCCCGQPPQPGCNQVIEERCLDQWAPITFKLTVSGVTMRSGCHTEPSGGSGEVVAGSVNRVYYLNVTGVSNGFSSHVWRGYFLTAERTAVAGALDFNIQCDSTPLPVKLTTVEIGLGEGQQFFVGITGHTFGFAHALTTATDFCDDPSTVASNEALFAEHRFGEGGTLTIEPCPPCIVECEGAPCAALSASGCSPLGETDCIGETEYVFVGRSAGRHAGGIWSGTGGVPAGCMWIYRPRSADRTLYIWNDGQDWQALLTRGSGTGEVEMARTKTAGSITCTGLVLAGTITLEAWFTDQGLGLGCDGCTITVTLGPCEITDCHEITANYLDATPVYFNSGTDFPAGDYEIEYLYGAISYNSNPEEWRVHAHAMFNHYLIVHSGGTEVEAPPTGVYTPEISEATFAALHTGSTVTFTHTGGPIGIYLLDSPYGDNILDASNGSRAPRFKLCPV